MRLALVLAAGLLATAASAHAETACTRPQPPAVVDGATATGEQIRASQAAAAAFLTASDAYQSCVVDSVKAQRDAAKDARKTFDKSIAKAADAELAANQADKESVGKAFNAAVHAFKAAHPS